MAKLETTTVFGRMVALELRGVNVQPVYREPGKGNALWSHHCYLTPAEWALVHGAMQLAADHHATVPQMRDAILSVMGKLALPSWNQDAPHQPDVCPRCNHDGINPLMREDSDGDDSECQACGHTWNATSTNQPGWGRRSERTVCCECHCEIKPGEMVYRDPRGLDFCGNERCGVLASWEG